MFQTLGGEESRQQMQTEEMGDNTTQTIKQELLDDAQRLNTTFDPVNARGTKRPQVTEEKEENPVREIQPAANITVRQTRYKRHKRLDKITQEMADDDVWEHKTFVPGWQSSTLVIDEFMNQHVHLKEWFEFVEQDISEMMGWKQRMERAMLGFVNQQKTMQDIADALTSTINYGAVDIKTPSREAYCVESKLFY